MLKPLNELITPEGIQRMLQAREHDSRHTAEQREAFREVFPALDEFCENMVMGATSADDGEEDLVACYCQGVLDTALSLWSTMTDYELERMLKL